MVAELDVFAPICNSHLVQRKALLIKLPNFKTIIYEILAEGYHLRQYDAACRGMWRQEFLLPQL